jgi:DNA adenine methylase
LITTIIKKNNMNGCDYVEPYAGGAGLALELLFNGLVGKIILNDSSKAVYAFWHSVLNNAEEFCRRIHSASLTLNEWYRQKEILLDKEAKLFDLGFSFFYMNRCNRSGIPTGGVIGGLKQDGIWKINSRFPRNELERRIELIASRKKSIVISNLDAECFINSNLRSMPKNALVYLDPPYYNKADRLYLDHYTHDDHVRLADIIQRKINQPWVLTYDCVPQIAGLYKARRKRKYNIHYNAAQVYRGKEVMVFSDKLHLP